ncbi:HigA family addiction module antitoxin [Dyella sp. C11]|uniref:HigA family addiction module antitoxin n=1 Tax=Dyella sp. C11 TaxID=2126991 RepID=UPI000D6556AA|nr:HigA family addiction module antitoxin [Dyella sp. C11]
MILDRLDTTVCFHPSVCLPSPGHALHHCMQSTGITTAQLARRTGIPVRHLRKLIRGQSPFTAKHALRLGDALNTSALYWLLLQAQGDLQRAMDKAVQPYP